MDKILTYTLREEDLPDTAGGVVNLVLKNRVGVTGHEISHAKYTPGGITVDGRQVTVKDRMQPGSVLRVCLDEEIAPSEHVVPAEGPLDVLYEDEDLIAVDKAAGTVVHPTHGHFLDSISNYLAWYYEQQGLSVTSRVAGRLDRDTSGVLLYAKNRAAAGRLYRQREDGTMSRTYFALVHGIFPENARKGTIDVPLEKDPDQLMHQRVAADGLGRRAVTHYEVLADTAAARSAQNTCGRSDSGDAGISLSIVRFHIDTGRTHQIRVHMAYAGHPLVGDPLYGDAEADRRLAEAGHLSVPERSMLHAAFLSLVQPFTGKPMTLASPFPADFAAIADAFGLHPEQKKP